ncbi:DUF5703 domain-containing protein [Sinomicrobium kalidii]|uniref:DUF5703 domain-containing protein n=1 Tax=Sinomicrobium kalidii TaxID=2900738 RepID=UPI001E493948|nr:DUF5703 domain-containing protein [Sinomicrobium kalidii]UGU15753.1 DUF5703 domain-containing protein [Sinomicrobium kalidii]
MKNKLPYILLILTAIPRAQTPVLEDYNSVWTEQSKNASESMPLGGGDIGLNVWVEQGDLYFYISRSGTFDEHNTLLKQGRMKIRLEPNPFDEDFKQELVLKDGYVKIEGGNVQVKLWVDVFTPVIHADIKSSAPVFVSAFYENWRYKNRRVEGKANNANSYKWAPQGDIITYRDSVFFEGNGIKFYHRNREETVFDVAVKQQGMEAVKEQMFNPLARRTSGGYISAPGMRPEGTTTGKYRDTGFKAWKLYTPDPVKRQKLHIYLHTGQAEKVESWHEKLKQNITTYNREKYTKREKRTAAWWHNFWERSFIYVKKQGSTSKDSVWQTGRNYQLFRYMLGCNAYGKYPTKFNGGLFTYDPVYVDSTLKFTPDHRNWGGGTMTAQNQRLVYFPMLKSGDFDMMDAQLDFYLDLQKNAELRSKVYWDHNGASFTEQLENFGLPNPSEYGWDRPEDYDPGMQYNAWLEYQWDTVLEFCLMMLERHRYNGDDIRKYLPFVTSCIRFFDEHYQYLARKRGAKALDENGHLVLYPGSAAETYKMTYNANATISALRVITQRLLELPYGMLNDTGTAYIREVSGRIPPLNYREMEGHKVLSPARLWERVNNTEVPQLYPVFPWGIYGVGRPGLETAQNTWKYDPDAIKFRSHIGWKQDNIFTARMGMTNEAARFTLKKMADSGRRFPAFWGPGFDWVPDHNRGGSGMIGMQEMLLQAVDKKIYLFPAWPAGWDVHFKLHAPGNTTVEAKLINGELKMLNVIPKQRENDVINMFNLSNSEKIKKYGTHEEN